MNNNVNVCGLISMILGIVSLFILPLWLGIASLILGLCGLVSAEGKGMAIAGIVLGSVSLVWYFCVSSLLISAM